MQRIKSVPDETKLLVVDAETDKYFKDKKIAVRGDMPNVISKSSDSDVSNGADPPLASRADSLPGNEFLVWSFIDCSDHI